MAVSFIDHSGQRQEIDLQGMALFKEAAEKGLTFRQLVNQKYPAASDGPDTFMQMCVSAGLRFTRDEQTGIPAARLAEIFDPNKEAAGQTFNNLPAIPDSRILFMPALLEVMEDKLQGRHDEVTNAFDSLVGYTQTIGTSRFDQPVLSYGGTGGPENAQFKTISQNTPPPMLLTLTSADVSRKVPTTSIGMEISFEALQANSLDVVALSLARFYKIANYHEWISQIGYLLSGDPDAAVTSFSAGTSALASVTATSYDSTIASAAGVLTQKAYLRFLLNNVIYMNKTHFVCDENTLLSIENRTNRPTNVQNNSMDRIDAPFRVIYPTFNQTIDILALPAGTFPANTIMAIDRNAPAIAKVTSTFATYEAIEDVVMRKARQIRIDRGFIAYRMWDSAFQVMTLT